MFVALLLFQTDYYHFTALQFTSNIYYTLPMMQSIYGFSCCCHCYRSKDSQHQSFEVGFTRHMLAQCLSQFHCSLSVALTLGCSGVGFVVDEYMLFVCMFDVENSILALPKVEFSAAASISC